MLNVGPSEGPSQIHVLTLISKDHLKHMLMGYIATKITNNVRFHLRFCLPPPHKLPRQRPASIV
jgi:hypothetical protein